MSIQAISHVWENSKQSGGALLCLLAIADYANDNWCAWPATATLARKSRMTERNVQLTLRKLEEDGEIKTFLKQGPKGTNLYHIMRGGGEKFSSGEGENPVRQISPCPDEAHFTQSVSTEPSGTVIKKKKEVQPKARKLASVPSSKPPKQTDPRIHEFITGWCERYERGTGRKYIVAGGKDGMMAKQLIQTTGMSVDELLMLAERAWSLDGRDRWLRDNAITISGFRSRINELQEKLTPSALVSLGPKERWDSSDYYGPKNL